MIRGYLAAIGPEGLGPSPNGGGPTMRLPVWLTLAALLAVAPALAVAQGGGSWLGKDVVRKDGTLMKVGKSAVTDQRGRPLRGGDEPFGFAVYRVERVQGGWLWLISSEFRGWAKAADVIPLDRAVDYYTGLVRARPN